MRLADVANEAVLLAGGARAILLQLANPAVGRGVARHSDFAPDPLRRLRNTLTFVYVVVYGTPAELARITRLVDATHAPIRGEGYDAVDPGLQLWVAATLYDTAVDLYERILGPLVSDDAEAIYQDYAVLGTALHMPADLWPRDLDSFRRYWAEASAGLRTDDETRAVARELLHPLKGPRWLRASMPLVRLVTTGLLPPDARAMFDLPWSARRQRRFDRAIRITAALYPRLPKRLRHWPRNHYLARFRRSTA